MISIKIATIEDMALLPQEMVTRIGRAYSAGQQALNALQIPNPESIEVALAVEAHRWFWKPQIVRTIILSNHREATSQKELGNTVKISWAKLNDQTPPNSFARTSYCLGYGEPILVPSLDESANLGDQAIWFTKAEIAEIESPITKLLDMQRLEWKYRILKKLYSRGIWLMDVSLFGDRGERELITSWYELYGSRVIENFESPRIVAFGKTLFEELQSIGIPVDDFIYHPKGLRQDDQKSHQAQALQSIHRLTSAPQF